MARLYSRIAYPSSIITTCLLYFNAVLLEPGVQVTTPESDARLASVANAQVRHGAEISVQPLRRHLDVVGRLHHVERRGLLGGGSGLGDGRRQPRQRDGLDF